MGNKQGKGKKQQSGETVALQDPEEAGAGPERQGGAAENGDAGQQRRMTADVPFEKYVFPFENLVFEGGGNKGLAYCGAVRVSREHNMLSIEIISSTNLKGVHITSL